MLNHYDSIIFDVDGTLWYACDSMAKLWSRAKLEYTGRDPHWTGKQLEPYFGRSLTEILELLAPELNSAERETLRQRFQEAARLHLREMPGRLYSGWEEALPRLARRYRLFIVSNCEKDYIEALLDSYALRPFFEGWLCWADTGCDKDFNLTLLKERYGLKKPVYVGDTQKDADSCKRAGIDVIYAAYGLGTIQAPAAVIHAPGELCELLL